MPRFALVKDPMKPLKDCEFFERKGATVLQFIAEEGLDMQGRICMVDSVKIEESDFGRPLNENALVVICPAVGFNLAILLLVAVLIAVAVYFLVDVPVTSLDSLPESDPVYTLRGQKNQTRLSEPVEKHYGKVRNWPSYMARPYNQFYNNDQYLFALLCVGLGEYDIHEIRVGETPISEFQDITYQIYQPGQLVTLFPTNVQTSTEVGGLELYGPNEEDYEEWTGPFVAASAGNSIYTLELDFACRQGLYSLNDKGKTRSSSVSVEAEARLIDDLGDPIGDWSGLEAFTRTASNTTPQRFTISVDVPPGRYEVRARRTSNKSSSNRVRHTIHWESLRAFCETEQNFGNVTLLAIKARATDNLNDNSKSGFNVITTAKVPVYDSLTSTWTKTATRNPVWAAIDVLRAKYGRRLKSKTIDLDAFFELAEDLETEEIWFDGTFDQRGTVWAALQTILAVANAVPVVPAGLISVVRDKPQTIPTLGFNGNNIGRDSVTVGTKLFQYASNDGIEVEYIDDETWKRRTVLCLIGADRGINPRQLKLIGCTDRNRAYRWGMYQRAIEIYQTDNVTFETGLEGGTAVYGDLIAVKHELIPSANAFVPDQTGRLTFGAFSTTAVEGDTRTVVTLPTKPMFGFGEVHRISFKDKKGVVRGPYLCEADPDDNFKVILDVELDTTDIAVDAASEQPLYWFGVSGREYALCKIVRLESTETHKIKVTAVPYDERVYGYADAIAPAIDFSFNTPALPSNPVVTNLTVVQSPDSADEYVASWSPALGASSYVVSKSYGGVTYEYVDTVFVSNCRFTIDPGESLWVSVYAVGEAAGPSVIWTSAGTVGGAESAPVKVTGLQEQEPFIGDTLFLTWDSADFVDLYRVQFYIGATLIYEKTTLASATYFSLANALGGCGLAEISIDRDISVKVRAENAVGNGEYSDTVVMSNPVPAAPNTLVYGAPTGTIYPVSWQHGFDEDLLECRVYASTVSGFTPGPGNLVATVPAYGKTSSIDAPVTTYWKVSAIDKWGSDEVFSAESTIP